MLSKLRTRYSDYKTLTDDSWFMNIVLAFILSVYYTLSDDGGAPLYIPAIACGYIICLALCITALINLGMLIMLAWQSAIMWVRDVDRRRRYAFGLLQHTVLGSALTVLTLDLGLSGSLELF